MSPVRANCGQSKRTRPARGQPSARRWNIDSARRPSQFVMAKSPDVASIVSPDLIHAEWSESGTPMLTGLTSHFAAGQGTVTSHVYMGGTIPFELIVHVALLSSFQCAGESCQPIRITFVNWLSAWPSQSMSRFLANMEFAGGESTVHAAIEKAGNARMATIAASFARVCRSQVNRSMGMLFR